MIYFLLFPGTCAITQLALLCTHIWEIAPVCIGFFMFSIFQIMDDNTITLTFARTKKYGDWGSAKADIALVSSIS